jgi:AraC-like DNA-binding protein
MQEQNYPKIYLYSRIVKAKLFIDQNFAEKIDLDDISDEAYFSKFHFIRLFRKIYGYTPYQYLTRVRIENAKLLLQKGENVSNVCFMVGLDSVSSFTGLFKSFVKMTPSVYRQIHLKKSEEQQKIPVKFIPNCFLAHGWIKNSNFQEVVL